LAVSAGDQPGHGQRLGQVGHHGAGVHPDVHAAGLRPEFTQVAYRVGDSVTNIISPMMSYFALIVAFIQRYVPKAGIGTVVATMLPYTFIFFLGWVVLLILWILLDLPLGPAAPMYLGR
jgi:aminobenzoyl-glutamate transport protein